jgi:DegV family protein with EDD domain
MPRSCVITDSSVYFPTPTYPGYELVTVMPLHVNVGDRSFTDSKDPRDLKNWYGYLNSHKPRLDIPSVEDFSRLYNYLSHTFDSIVAILHSNQLSPLIENARQAAQQVKHPNGIFVVDSQTLGAGLGVLVQAAAQCCMQQQDAASISQMLRGMLPHIYTVAFLPNFAYLADSGYLDPAQAVVGEMLGFFPFYVLESGRMVSVQKARNSRQLVEMLSEFVTEFTDLRHITLFQGYPPYEAEMRSLRERISKLYPETPLVEHHLSLSLLSLLGPRPLGVVVVEMPAS